MGKKVVSYQQLLKEAISEFDTSQNVDVKGPMLDPILSYEGDGELPTYKDAASVLERYYFNEKQEAGVEVSEADYENDKGKKSKAGSEHTEGPGGEEQAGTSDAATIPASKDEKGKDIAKEGALAEKEWDDKDVPKKKEYTDESDDLTEEVENAVIEKLIAEMEEEDDEDDEDDDDDDDDEKEDVKESDGNPASDFKGVPDAAQEKKAKGPEEDTKGAGGTEQAGTGTDAGQVPDRKDRADQMVKPKNYNEQDEVPAGAGDEEGEDEEDLDVDKKVAEASGPGAVPPPALKKNMGGEDEDSGEELDESLDLEEAFELFKEEIEKDDEDEGEEEEEEEKE